MALPNGTGGYQIDAGDPAEPRMFRQLVTNLVGGLAVMQTFTSSLVVHNPGNAGAAQLTLPGGIALDALVPNAVKGHAFDVVFVNASTVAAEVITLGPGANMTFIGGRIINPANGNNTSTSATVRFVKTDVGLWTAYRIA